MNKFELRQYLDEHGYEDVSLDDFWEGLDKGEMDYILDEFKMEQLEKERKSRFDWMAENVGDIIDTEGMYCKPRVLKSGKKVLECDVGYSYHAEGSQDDLMKFFITREVINAGSDFDVKFNPKFEGVSFEGSVTGNVSIDECAVFGRDKEVSDEIKEEMGEYGSRGAYEILQCGISKELMKAIENKHSDPDFGGTRFTMDYQRGNVNPYL